MTQRIVNSTDIDVIDEELDEVIDKQEEEFNIPAKFNGKSASEIAKSYVELEKEFGRKNNELGELRKLTDRYLELEVENKRKVDTKNEPELEEIDAETLIEKPRKVVNDIVSNNATVKSLEERLSKTDLGIKQMRFETKFPNFLDEAKKEDFQEWVLSSKYRTNMFVKADNYDFDAADDLMSMWTEKTNSEKSEQDKVEKEVRRGEKMRKAGTASTTGVTGDVSSSKKIWPRSEIIRMKIEEPSKYASLANEIRQAYVEGRVK